MIILFVSGTDPFQSCDKTDANLEGGSGKYPCDDGMLH